MSGGLSSLRSAGGCCYLVAVELCEVVGRGDQPPFRERGGAAAALEPVDPAVVFGVSEHGLDGLFALLVDRVPELGLEDAPHVVINAAGPAGTGFLFEVGVRGNQDLGAARDDVLHLAFVPVAGVRDDDPRTLADTGQLEVAQRGFEHRFEVPEVR